MTPQEEIAEIGDPNDRVKYPTLRDKFAASKALKIAKSKMITQFENKAVFMDEATDTK